MTYGHTVDRAGGKEQTKQRTMVLGFSDSVVTHRTGSQAQGEVCETVSPLTLHATVRLAIELVVEV